MAEEEAATVAENTDAPAPEAEATQEPIEEPKAEEPSPDTPEAESEPATEPKKVDKAQRKIAAIEYEKRELRRQNAQLAKALEAQAKAPVSDAKAPQIEAFQTIEEYLDARDKWRDEQRAPQPESEQDDDFEVAKEDLFQGGNEKYDDFTEVMTAQNVKITKDMAKALVEIDDLDLQVDTAYFLGSNPKEAARIAKLSPVRQIREVAKLEAKLATKAKPAKRPSAAPEPIKPVGGSKTSTDEIQETEPFESFLKKRNKQLGR